MQKCQFHFWGPWPDVSRTMGCPWAPSPEGVLKTKHSLTQNSSLVVDCTPFDDVCIHYVFFVLYFRFISCANWRSTKIWWVQSVIIREHAWVVCDPQASAVHQNVLLWPLIILVSAYDHDHWFSWHTNVTPERDTLPQGTTTTPHGPWLKAPGQKRSTEGRAHSCIFKFYQGHQPVNRCYFSY